MCVRSLCAADEQVLALKEQTLFKQVLRFYETKQYKKALKSADAILKKNPNHGGSTHSQPQRSASSHTAALSLLPLCIFVFPSSPLLLRCVLV